jgi:hypothetical protein
MSGLIRACGIELGTTNSGLALVDAPSSKVGLP